MKAPSRINLLPWRHRERVRQARVLLAASMSAVLFGLLLLWAAHWMLGDRIDGQERRNRLLEREIALLESGTARAREQHRQHRHLLARLSAIRHLQDQRPVVARVFDELANTLIDGIHYRRIEQRDQVLSVTGVASSNERISAQMRSIEGSPWFAYARLERISDDPRNQAYSSGASTFEMSFARTQPAAPAAAPPGP